MHQKNSDRWRQIIRQQRSSIETRGDQKQDSFSNEIKNPENSSNKLDSVLSSAEQKNAVKTKMWLSKTATRNQCSRRVVCKEKHE